MDHPAGQFEQLVAQVAATNWPAAQHTPLPAGAEKPDGQAGQDLSKVHEVSAL
jgi:hypothetical protein